MQGSHIEKRRNKTSVRGGHALRRNSALTNGTTLVGLGTRTKETHGREALELGRNTAGTGRGTRSR